MSSMVQEKSLGKNNVTGRFLNQSWAIYAFLFKTHSQDLAMMLQSYIKGIKGKKPKTNTEKPVTPSPSKPRKNPLFLIWRSDKTNLNYDSIMSVFSICIKKEDRIIFAQKHVF